MDEQARLAMARAISRRIAGRLDDDLIQEALIAIWRAESTFNPNFGVPFQAYAYRRAHGVAVDYLRTWTGHRRRYKAEHWDPRELLPPEPAAVDDDLLDQEQREDLLRQINRLPARWAALLRRQLDGETQASIAQDLGVTQSAVSQTTIRAVERLHKLVA